MQKLRALHAHTLGYLPLRGFISALQFQLLPNISYNIWTTILRATTHYKKLHHVLLESTSFSTNLEI